MSLVVSLGIAIRHQAGASAPAPATRPVNTLLPAITGTAQQGQVLSADTGGWMGNPTSLTRQWRRNGVAIAGAVAASYTLVAADLGSTISLAVTAANAQGSTTAVSAATEPVTASSATSTVVVGLLGQSNIQYIMGGRGTAWDGIPEAQRPVITTQNMIFVAPSSGDDGGDETAVSAWPVTTANINANRRVSASVGVLSQTLAHIMPGTQFAVIDLAKSGTGRRSVQTDGYDPARSWTSIEAPIAFARQEIGEISLIFEWWTAADISTIPNFGNAWADFYMGENFDGTPATIGQDGLDHILWDITAPADQRGRGLFSRDATKWAFLLGGTNEANMAGYRTFAADPRTQTFLGFEAGPIEMGARAGGHALNNDPDGGIYTMFTFVPGFLQAAGMTVGTPQVTGIETAADGSYADLIVSLPNGGNLTTIRALESRADPATPPEDYQPVMGVEVERLGDAPSDRLAIVPVTNLLRDAKYRGTVAVQDAGTGAVPARTGRVRITPEVPFSSGDRLTYRQDSTYSVSTAQQRDVTNKDWLAYLIETVPAWRDTGAQYPFPGVSVFPSGTEWVTDVSTPPTNPLATPVVLANAGAITGGTLRESPTFTPTAGEGLFVIAAMYSALSTGGGLAQENIVGATIGAPGRAAGTGTPLTLLENLRRTRCALLGFRVDAPETGEQTVQIEWATNSPSNLRMMVVQVPNAEPVEASFWSANNDGVSRTSRALSPTVTAANNGVLYAMAVQGGDRVITSTSGSTLIFAGDTGAAGNKACYLMVRWDVPGAAGAQSETFSWDPATGNNRGFAIQVAPQP